MQPTSKGLWRFDEVFLKQGSQCCFGGTASDSSHNCRFFSLVSKVYQMWPGIVAGRCLFVLVLLHHDCILIKRQMELIVLPGSLQLVDVLLTHSSPAHSITQLEQCSCNEGTNGKCSEVKDILLA